MALSELTTLQSAFLIGFTGFVIVVGAFVVFYNNNDL